MQVLNDFYEPKAALRTDESSTIIVGLLTSLDVVDCNLCLKEDELDGKWTVFGANVSAEGVIVVVSLFQATKE